VGGRLDPEVYRLIATLQARGVRFEVCGGRFKVVGVLADSEKSQVKAWREAILEALGQASRPDPEPTSRPLPNCSVCGEPLPAGFWCVCPVCLRAECDRYGRPYPKNLSAWGGG
jgi:hypothetical protein